MKNQREFIKSSLSFKIMSFLPIIRRAIIFFILIGLLTSQNVKSQTGSSFDQAVPNSQGDTLGTIGIGESVFYVFSTSANFELLFSLSSLDSSTDFDLFLHDSSNGDYLGRSNGLTYPEQISFRSLSEGSIVIQVFSLNSEGDFTLTISLKVETSENRLPLLNSLQLLFPFILALVYRKKIQ